MYVGVKKMEILHEDKSDTGAQALAEVEAALSYPPNNAILGSNSLRFPLPFGLWIYNSFVGYQEVGLETRLSVDRECRDPLESSDEPAARLWVLPRRRDLFDRFHEE